MDGTYSLVRDLSRVGWVGGVFNGALAAQIGMGATDLQCVWLLRDGGATTPGELAELMGLTTGAMTGVIDRLERAGYVSRQNDPGDRRRVIVQPVQERMAEVDRLYEPLVQAVDHSLAGYSPDQIHLLMDYHRRMYRLLRTQIDQARAQASEAAQHGHSEPHLLSAPLADATAGRLEFANGVSHLTVRCGDQPLQLYAACVQGLQPDVHVEGGTITFRYRRIGVFDWRRHIAEVGLNPTIPWTIALRGGASKVMIDTRNLRLAALHLDGGASELAVLLSPAAGSVCLQIRGGVSRAQIVRPADVPVELRIGGGASRLELDEQRFGAIGGDVRLTSPGFELASDRYQIEVSGGASRLEVIAASPERLADWPEFTGSK